MRTRVEATATPATTIGAAESIIDGDDDGDDICESGNSGTSPTFFEGSVEEEDDDADPNDARVTTGIFCDDSHWIKLSISARWSSFITWPLVFAFLG
jgi:hypothetical protein